MADRNSTVVSLHKGSSRDALGAYDDLTRINSFIASIGTLLALACISPPESAINAAGDLIERLTAQAADLAKKQWEFNKKLNGAHHD